MRNAMKPTVTLDNGPIGGEIHKHDAFGVITLNSTTGDAELFGSDIGHNHYMTIGVHRAELRGGAEPRLDTSERERRLWNFT